MVPGINGNGDTVLFIPVIGGEQLTDDGDTIATNGKYSNISVLLDPEGDWAYQDNLVTVLLTGDSKVGVALATAYDIHDLGVVCRNGVSLVFILTAMYGGTDYNRLYYRIYFGTVDGLLSLLTPPATPLVPPTAFPPSLSDAVRLGALTVIDEGEVESDPSEPEGLYHPSISIVQHPTDPEKDLVVFCTGSTILVTRALAYGSPTAHSSGASLLSQKKCNLTSGCSSCHLLTSFTYP